MSIEAISWAFKQPMKAALKLLLVALADYANTEDLVWPSVAALKEKTCQDRKTIIAGIKTLVEMGYLTQQSEKTGKTRLVRVFKINRDLSTNETKNGTVQTVPDFLETVPNFLETVPNFPETVPKTGPVTIYNQYNHKKPQPTKKEQAVDNVDTQPIRPEVQLSIVFRQNGVIATPANPKVIELANQGIKPETVSDACQEAKASLGDKRVSLNYVVAILERWAREAKEISVKGARRDSKPWHETASGYFEKGKELGIEYDPVKGEFPTFRNHVDIALGRSLGMEYDESEPFDTYRQRVLSAYERKQYAV